MDKPDHDRLMGRLDHMVERGRMTEAEAAALRAASDPSEVDAVLCSIRLRHATPKLAEAVEQGAMTEDEAEVFRDRLRRGEHPRSLRAHLRRRKRGGTDG
jgi:polyhydroxyalkanoate synthesis regulator phasin